MLVAGVAAIALMSVVRSNVSEGWTQPATLLATSGALALVIHVWRSAYLARLEVLGQESEGRRLELERSVAALELEVSEREQLQEQLIKTQNLESLGRMAGGVAHDFNNLLLIIRGHAELARDELPTSGPVRPQLEPLELNELVREKGSWSGSPSGRAPLSSSISKRGSCWWRETRASCSRSS